MITVDVMGVLMTLVETTAPARYDYGGLTLIGDATPDKGSTRLALIPLAALDAQLTRYASGLYSGTVVDEALYAASDIYEQLHHALDKQLGSGRSERVCACDIIDADTIHLCSLHRAIVEKDLRPARETDVLGPPKVVTCGNIEVVVNTNGVQVFADDDELVFEAENIDNVSVRDLRQEES